MEKYSLYTIKQRTSKDGKKYNLAYVIFENNYDVQILNILLQEKQVESLMKVLTDRSFDLNKYIKIEYNTYTKAYRPVITYGL